MHSDPTGHSAFPNWIKLLIGGIAIVGLGVGTCYTGGPLGVLFGAAFLGSLIGAAGGTLAGGLIGGAVTGKWSGFCNGASYGFMLGALIGAVVGAASVGSNMMFGGLKIEGSAQVCKRTFFHRMASNLKAGKMSMQYGKYSRIRLNRSLSTSGLTGRRMPDIIGIAKKESHLLVEVTSYSQTNLQMEAKLGEIIAQNPNCVKQVIGWAGNIARWFS